MKPRASTSAGTAPSTSRRVAIYTRKSVAIGAEETFSSLDAQREACEHYTRAQYVLPHQDKGPLLFYNIGLCYARWGKHKMAQEFLKIALIKEPTYRKAQKLLEQVDLKYASNNPVEIEDVA